MFHSVENLMLTMSLCHKSHKNRQNNADNKCIEVFRNIETIYIWL